jgi:hypothetical protein
MRRPKHYNPAGDAAQGYLANPPNNLFRLVPVGVVMLPISFACLSTAYGMGQLRQATRLQPAA